MEYFWADAGLSHHSSVPSPSRRFLLTFDRGRDRDVSRSLTCEHFVDSEGVLVFQCFQFETKNVERSTQNAPNVGVIPLGEGWSVGMHGFECFAG